MDKQALIDMLQRNFGVLQRQVEGLTHADSLLPLPFRGNCLNWVLGHIVQSRDRMLQVAGEESVWTPQQIARYQRDSEPITGPAADVIPLEKMLADLATSQERLMDALERMTEGDLSVAGKEVIAGAPPWTIAQWLHFLLWHETYHVGQTEMLRQLTGVNDKVI